MMNVGELLNPEHPEFKRLQQVMTADTLATREHLTSTLDRKARQFMNFHREATNMMIRAKQSRHEPA